MPVRLAICYSSPPRKTVHANAELNGGKKRVDEINETLHNLASSLTNTTLRSKQYRIKFFKN